MMHEGDRKTATVIIDEMLDEDSLNVYALVLLAQMDNEFDQNYSAALLTLKHVQVSDGVVSFSYAGEHYLNNAAVKLNIPAQVILSKQRIQLTDAKMSVNDLAVELTGSVENDTINKRVVTDFSYEFKSWSIPTLLALVPPSFRSYLVFDADGELSSNGSVKGIYSNTSMPLMDIHLYLKDGSLKNSNIHLPLSHINADVAFYSDMVGSRLISISKIT